jgi:DNA-binding MarR family transcriptional regulator
MTTTLPVDVSARIVAEALAELVRVVQFRDRDRACCHGVSVSQCYALKGVVEAGGLTVNELAGYLYLEKSTASRIANGLVERGLVTRQRDPDDGRVVRLVPTTEGDALASRIEEDLLAEYTDLVADFDPTVRSDVADLVSRLGHALAQRVDASGGSCCVVQQSTPEASRDNGALPRR